MGGGSCRQVRGERGSHGLESFLIEHRPLATHCLRVDRDETVEPDLAGTSLAVPWVQVRCPSSTGPRGPPAPGRRRGPATSSSVRTAARRHGRPAVPAGPFPGSDRPRRAPTPTRPPPGQDVRPASARTRCPRRQPATTTATATSSSHLAWLRNGRLRRDHAQPDFTRSRAARARPQSNSGSSRFITLPVGLRGSSSRNIVLRGTANFATRSLAKATTSSCSREAPSFVTM